MSKNTVKVEILLTMMNNCASLRLNKTMNQSTNRIKESKLIHGFQKPLEIPNSLGG